MSKPAISKSGKSQRERFEEAARDAGADMGKEEFSRVIGKISKSKGSLKKNQRRSTTKNG